jgi:hypothetical protein
MNLYLADGQQVVELSFVQVAAPAAPSFTSTLVQTFVTTDTNWSPYSSPDPTGIIYLPGSGMLSGTLLIADSEVDELTIPPNAVQYKGVNLFESSLTGALVATMTTWYTPTQIFSDEPTGVTLNPANNNLFISDDDANRVYEVDPGTDGIVWPGPGSDDTVTSFRTADFGNQDPEGVTYASDLGTLFIVDGLNAEVYHVSPGVNGIFDGLAPAGDDVLINQFDMTGLGSINPEGIAYNPDTGRLYVVGSPWNDLYEVTTEGTLVRIIDIKAAPAVRPSGLAYAPSSVSPGVMNIYIAARGIDENANPLENDGQVYEMTLPTNPPPVAVDDGATTDANTPVIIDVAANDSDPSDPSDPEYHPLDPSSATNTNCQNVCSEPNNGTLTNNNNGTFTYTPDLNFNGIDKFVYEICDTEPACDTAEVTIVVGEIEIFIPLIIRN